MSVPPAVVGLLLGAGPAAIAKLIVAVHVDAVDRHADRARAHIRKEVLVTGLPALAHGDAPPAVGLPPAVIRVATALPHGKPRVPCRGAHCTVFRHGSAPNLGLETPARFGVT